VIIYAFFASVLPVWLLLAPRDYLSTFMKLGTIFALAVGVLLVLPDLRMPPLTRFIDGSGPVVPGKLFPFCFITIACGAISGFHTLISSGITPKIITRENYARPVGYGAMCLESLVAIMAMIAACTLEPGVYLAMNVKVPGPDAAAIATATVAKVSGYGPEFALSAERMANLAREVKEESLYGRTGGAATLAVGMANLFHRAWRGLGNDWLGIWYHFALMFEALFILTTLDAGTRVGRYLLQDALGHFSQPLGDVKSIPANLLASGAVVLAWGYFLVAAVNDPDGGIKALWPIFGIANQLLAGIALCLATTVILKMALAGGPVDLKSQISNLKSRPRPILALVTLVPLCWLLAVTGTAAVQKIGHIDPKIGFIAQAHALSVKLEQLKARTSEIPPANLPGHQKLITQTARQLGNNYLDAAVTGFFLALVVLIVLLSGREWILLLARKRAAELRETPPTWLPDYAVAEGKPFKLFSLLALTFALVKELSGEAAVDRAARHAAFCPTTAPRVDLLGGGEAVARRQRQQAYVQATEQKFNQPNRCC
jgi:carbon starvation protein